MPASESHGAVLITGASTGIGYACCVALDALGYPVFAGVRTDAAAADLREVCSERLVPLHLDVTQPDSILAAVAQIGTSADEGRLHGLVNNAGIAAVGPMEHVPIADLRRQFEVNFFGQVAVTQAMTPLLRRAAAVRRARIINMSSVSGCIAVPFGGPYAASKFALEAVSDAMRIELRPHGIDVVLIEPGVIDTPIWQKSSQVIDQMPPEVSDPMMAHYGDSIDKARRGIEEARQHAIPADAVASVVVKALQARRPRSRYPVGRGARRGLALKRLLPAGVFDAILARESGLRPVR